MTEVKTISDEVLFTYDENTTTLVEVISNYKELRHACLIEADLRGADFSNADLLGADLRCANLTDANFTNAILTIADFNKADLYRANFKNANLRGTFFDGANLNCANFEGADMYDTYFGGARNVPEEIPMACPREGSFIAWKKIKRRYLVKLEIPEDAKRSSATTNKCRCSKAKVLEIIDMIMNKKVNEVINANYALCTYTVGEMVYPDYFDENRWNECSHGIHFFKDKRDAINWQY